MYLNARNWGVQPSEFWGMTMAEWFCEYRANAKQEPGRFAGKLTEDDVYDLLEIANMSDEEWRSLKSA